MFIIAVYYSLLQFLFVYEGLPLSKNISAVLDVSLDFFEDCSIPIFMSLVNPKKYLLRMASKEST